MTAPLVRPLPEYIEKAGTKRVLALQVGMIIPSPRGFSVYPADERYAAFELSEDTVAELDLSVGDYLVWTEGEPVQCCGPVEFEAYFRLAAS